MANGNWRTLGMVGIRYADGQGWRAAFARGGSGTFVEGFETPLEALAALAPKVVLTVEQLLSQLSGPDFGWVLEPYHDGAHIYAVVSFLIAGHEPQRESIIRAHHALLRWKADANYPEEVTPEDDEATRLLAGELVRRYGFEK